MKKIIGWAAGTVVALPILAAAAVLGALVALKVVELLDPLLG